MNTGVILGVGAGVAASINVQNERLAREARGERPPVSSISWSPGGDQRVCRRIEAVGYDAAFKEYCDSRVYGVVGFVIFFLLLALLGCFFH